MTLQTLAATDILRFQRPSGGPVSTPARTAGRAEPARQRVQLFVNPSAGSCRSRQVAALKAEFERAGALVSTTQSVRELRTLIEDVDHVCAVGGDGTIRDAVAVVRKARNAPSLSVYPLGTVNLLARECGYPGEIDGFVQRALERPAPRSHHVALIGDTIMLTCASVGPDSRAIDLLPPRLKRMIGRAAYVVAFCAIMACWRRPCLTVSSGGMTVACEAVYVAKGRLYAGPWSFAPTAAVDEPLLHVVAIPRATRMAAIAFAWDLLRRREPRNVIRFASAKLTIAGDDRLGVQADGDIVARLPVEIRIASEPLAFA